MADEVEIGQDPGDAGGFAEGHCATCGRVIRVDDGGDVDGLCKRCGLRFAQFLKNLDRRGPGQEQGPDGDSDPGDDHGGKVA
jgi:hypothetical protein